MQIKWLKQIVKRNDEHTEDQYTEQDQKSWFNICLSFKPASILP